MYLIDNKHREMKSKPNKLQDTDNKDLNFKLHDCKLAFDVSYLILLCFKLHVVKSSKQTSQITHHPLF